MLIGGFAFLTTGFELFQLVGFEPPLFFSFLDSAPKTKSVDIDTALTLTGHRWFHWRLLLIGGFAFLATGFEFTLHAYILPFAQCDLSIDAADMGVINALFLAGRQQLHGF